MTTITFPTNTKDVIDAIRGAIGREVVFYKENLTDCPICTLDPITNTSTDPYCPVCSGVGYLITYSGVNLLGHITWSPSEAMNWVTGGQFIEGDCRVQIEYSITNLATVHDADYVMVDDRKFRVNKQTFRGVPTINRILIDLKEEEES